MLYERKKELLPEHEMLAIPKERVTDVDDVVEEVLVDQPLCRPTDRPKRSRQRHQTPEDEEDIRVVDVLTPPASSSRHHHHQGHRRRRDARRPASSSSSSVAELDSSSSVRILAVSPPPPLAQAKHGQPSNLPQRIVDKNSNDMVLPSPPVKKEENCDSDAANFSDNALRESFEPSSMEEDRREVGGFRTLSAFSPLAKKIEECLEQLGETNATVREGRAGEIIDMLVYTFKYTAESLEAEVAADEGSESLVLAQEHLEHNLRWEGTIASAVMRKVEEHMRECSAEKEKEEEEREWKKFAAFLLRKESQEDGGENDMAKMRAQHMVEAVKRSGIGLRGLRKRAGERRKARQGEVLAEMTQSVTELVERSQYFSRRNLIHKMSKYISETC